MKEYSMNLNNLSVGSNPPYDVNVVIEISAGSAPIKYEFNKEAGAICVDRFLSTAMYYPTNYGFIPHTLGQDGDPVDALVLSPAPIIPGAVVRVRPIGVLMMEDEAGHDEKILMVPVSKLTPYYDAIKTYEDLQPIILKQINHFFERYKDLESSKWVKVTGWQGPEIAAEMIEKGMHNK